MNIDEQSCRITYSRQVIGLVHVKKESLYSLLTIYCNGNFNNSDNVYERFELKLGYSL